MKEENVHMLIDLCAEAARLRQYFPALPNGLTPRDIRVAERLQILSQQQERVKVSDISEMLEVTRPGVTSALNTLTRLGYAQKEKDAQDGRIVYVQLTPSGEALVLRTVTDFHKTLAETAFRDFDDDEIARMAELVHCAVERTREWSKTVKPSWE